MENEMKKTVIALVAALAISLASAAPAKAWYGGWGGYGWGGYGAAVGIMAGSALLGGVIGGALASPYGYGYGYPYAYGYGVPVYNYPPAVAVPTYAYPAYRTPAVRKQVIIKNSPGARVYEEDDIFGW